MENGYRIESSEDHVTRSKNGRTLALLCDGLNQNVTEYFQYWIMDDAINRVSI
jgi:hypothetical protein